MHQILNNRYEVIKLINEGYFSLIYTAKELESHSEVAVKQLKYEDDSEMKNEFEIMIRLAPFDYIPTPLEFGVNPDNSSFFIISMEGKSLYELQAENNNNKFTSNTTTLILLHSLVAIKSVHESGIAHGDISFKNVGVPNSAGKKRIILHDFGCAVPADPISTRRDIMDVLNVTEQVSIQNRTLKDCCDEFEGSTGTTVNDLIKMISDQPMFNPESPFDWELE
ncbi:Protein CBG14431 [Caenorhabditis briggsae]|uniref:Protein kinase domain-containing protein n=2 Tax=Caenorhabditis briggsae TaxID=6238 RepID=A0AAE8ZQ08_CAEBR|nr:Protein CBG14431 [Caenorhabditis briggsae]ULT81536.1 hypothetical protein L3Y34_011478 [Caenorhabditis briggsae]CAP32962.1 Protein CBG14431 [Caenorhabditis briggsae]